MHTIVYRGLTIVLIFLLVYTRFVNLGWGLPYPMHPDERNMADAMMKIRCEHPSEFIRGIVSYAPRNIYRYLTSGEYTIPSDTVECMNPHFYAYGQLSLYSASMFAHLIHTISQSNQEVRFSADFTFSEAVMGLRLLSAIVSCITPLVLLKILTLLDRRFSAPLWRFVALLFFILSPVLIQFSHFGTTEAILILWFSILTYLAIRSVKRKNILLKDVVLMSLVCGLAIATKVSSLLYLFIPWMVILVKYTSIHFVTLSKLIVRQSPTHLSTGGVISDSTQDNLLENIHEGKDTQGMAPQTDHDRQDADTDPVATTTRASQVPSLNTLLSHYQVLVFISWLRFLITIGVSVLCITFGAGIVSVIFSPHNAISLRELLGSMHYESDVGLGRYIAFYTRQFLWETPLFFQIQHIFPYVMGISSFVLSCIGFVFLPYKRSYNMLRFSTIIYAVLTMGWYAKWTRFLAPTYPLLTIFAVCGLFVVMQRVRRQYRSHRLTSLVGSVLVLLGVLPGIAFSSIYASRDVRFTASEWIYNHIPPKSYVLSETANVIDVPIPDVRANAKIPDGFDIQYLSFNSYEVDADRQLQKNMQDAIAQADYIFVPSRRVYYNHTCVGLDGAITSTRHSKAKCEYLARTYPVLKKYYEDLFSGRLGFEKVAEFSSFPRIQLFGRTLFELPDESAEETFTVFDHPVMRVYKRNSGK